MNITQRYRVTGYVQGVGFRAYAMARALTLDLSGYVRNRRDQSVEVLAMGPLESIEAFHRALLVGPEGSRVDQVSEMPPGHDENPQGFSILPTI